MISIVMATYNGSRYIEEQLDSILAQTFSDFKILVVDDCSTDNTVSILKKYSLRDTRISIYENQTNLGCGRTFERGVMLADSKFIALVDQDDIWCENKLEILISELLQSNLDMVYSSCNLIDGNGELLDYRWNSISPLFGTDSDHPNISLVSAFNSFVLGCSMICRAESLKKCLPFELARGNHDKWIVSNISFWGKFKFIDKELFSYRLHENNFSMKRRNPLERSGFLSKFHVRLPFYNAAAVQRIIEVGEGVGVDTRVYTRLHLFIRRFYDGGIVGRLRLVAAYYPYLFLRPQGMKRAREFIKLTLTPG